MDELIEYLSGFLTKARLTKLHQVLDNRTSYIRVGIENVYHDHNTSAILRNCDCMGIQTLDVIDSKYGYTPSRRTTRGAEKWITVNTFPTTSEAIMNIKKEGYQLVATVPSINSIPIEDFDTNKPFCLFFGTEKDGLSEEIKVSADRLVHIPIKGFSESYNVSVSAALALYSIRNKFCNRPEWKLPDEMKEELLLDWVIKSIPNGHEIAAQFIKKRHLFLE